MGITREDLLNLGPFRESGKGDYGNPNSRGHGTDSAAKLRKLRAEAAAKKAKADATTEAGIDAILKDVKPDVEGSSPQITPEAIDTNETPKEESSKQPVADTNEDPLSSSSSIEETDTNHYAAAAEAMLFVGL